MITTRHLLEIYDEMDTDADQDASPCLRVKLLSLEICRNCCLTHASSETVLDIVLPVLGMITALLEHGASFTRDAANELGPPLSYEAHN